MHLRVKPWARPELLACGFFIEAPFDEKNKWSQLFAKKQPIHLELGCGKGQFIAQQAYANPDINFLAIDMIDAVLGLTKRNICATFGDRPVDNCRITAWDIGRIDAILGEADVMERIYINFCNPWPKRRHYKKRLTYHRQLEAYKKFLALDGEIHFKTDDDNLFEASLDYFDQAGFDILFENRNLPANAPISPIITEHEQMFRDQGISIKFLIARQRTSSKTNPYA